MLSFYPRHVKLRNDAQRDNEYSTLARMLFLVLLRLTLDSLSTTSDTLSYSEMSSPASNLVWPQSIKQLQNSRPLVYLDLNHWIFLAQASVGHSEGKKYAAVLDVCRAAVGAGEATFALAGTHYAELLKIVSPRRRRDVAAVMEELTRFMCLLSRTTVMTLEFSAALDSVLNLPRRDPDVDLVGRGVGHAFGTVGEFRVRDRESGDDVTATFRQQYGAEAFDAFMANAMLEYERGMLVGPKDDVELKKLQALNYDPQQVLQVAKNRGAEEAAQRLRLDGDGTWRSSKLPDVVAARELWIEFQAIAPVALLERGVSLDQVLTSPETGVAFMRSMPSTDVAMTLKTAWHRNRDKPWSGNDIYDIDAMALAVPYCDVVVTEKACHHALVAADIGNRMNTVLLNSLLALPEVLIGWRSP